jgi:hypothetical protein
MKPDGKLMMGETGFSSDEEHEQSADELFYKYFSSSSLSSMAASFRAEQAAKDSNSNSHSLDNR